MKIYKDLDELEVQFGRADKQARRLERISWVFCALWVICWFASPIYASIKCPNHSLLDVIIAFGLLGLGCLMACLWGLFSRLAGKKWDKAMEKWSVAKYGHDISNSEGL